MNKHCYKKLFKLFAGVVLIDLAYANDALASEVRTMPGRVICQVAFSSDGKTLASVTRRRTNLWDVESHKRIGTLNSRYGVSQALSWSPAAKSIAETGRDDIQICSIPSGRLLRTFGAKQIPACCLAFSPDGGEIISACYRVPTICGAKTGKQVKTLEPLLPKNAELDLCATINSVAWSPDGKTVAGGTDGMGVRVWDVPSGNLSLKLEPTTTPIIKIAFSPDGKILVAGLDNGFIVVWDTKLGKQLRCVRAHSERVTDVIFTPDSRHLVSAGDGCVKLWDLDTGAEIRKIQITRGYSHAIALSPDGKTLASSGWDEVSLIDLESGIELAKFDSR